MCYLLWGLWIKVIIVRFVCVYAYMHVCACTFWSRFLFHSNITCCLIPYRLFCWKLTTFLQCHVHWHMQFKKSTVLETQCEGLLLLLWDTPCSSRVFPRQITHDYTIFVLWTPLSFPLLTFRRYVAQQPDWEVLHVVTWPWRHTLLWLA